MKTSHEQYRCPAPGRIANTRYPTGRPTGRVSTARERASVLQVCKALLVLMASISGFSPLAGNASAVADHPEIVYGQQPTYTITRDGKKIGTHQISFNRNGDQLDVEIQTDIAVRILKIPVYRFTYASSERWVAHSLVQVRSTIEENRKTRVIENNHFASSSEANDSNQAQGSIRYATNHWNPRILKESVVFNTLTGESNAVTVESQGTDRLKINNRNIDAVHYRYSGDLEVDTWYDEQMRWVKLRFEGEDGSTIEYLSDGFAPN